MTNDARNSMLTIVMKEELAPSERETLGSFVEGMTGVKNIYPLATEDLQAIAAYIMEKTNA